MIRGIFIPIIFSLKITFSYNFSLSYYSSNSISTHLIPCFFCLSIENKQGKNINQTIANNPTRQANKIHGKSYTYKDTYAHYTSEALRPHLG